MNICNNPDILRAIMIIKYIFEMITVLLPLIIIFLITFDLFKVVTNNTPDKSMKEVLITNGKRVTAALIVFFLPALIEFTFTKIISTDSSFNECYTNAEVNIIRDLLEQRKLERENEKEEKQKNNQLLYEKLQEKTDAYNEKIKDIKDKITAEIEASKNTSFENYGTSNIYNTEALSSLSNPNLKAKTYNGSKQVNYWELVPPNVSKNPALIVFLHGSGECGNLNSMLRTGLPKFMNNGSLDNYDAIFIAPNTASCSWSSDAASTKELIDYVIKEYNIDTEHIIITGHSLGGNGTWNMISKYPTFFSAAVPVSGCPYDNASNYTTVPIKSFVGASESSYISCNNNIDTINNMGGKAELIQVPSPYDSHSGVINIYGDSNLINWMIRQ